MAKKRAELKQNRWRSLATERIGQVQRGGNSCMGTLRHFPRPVQLSIACHSKIKNISVADTYKSGIRFQGMKFANDADALRGLQTTTIPRIYGWTIPVGIGKSM